MDDKEWRDAMDRYVGDKSASEEDVRRAVALITAAITEGGDVELISAALRGVTTDTDRPPLVAILGLLASLVALNVRSVVTMASLAEQKPADMWRLMLLELGSES